MKESVAMTRRICVFTGGRAEYGLLKPLLDEIKKDLSLELKLLVSGMHLSQEFGLTHKVIEEDGFIVNEKVEIILSSDTPISVCKSMGLGMISFSEAIVRMKPDIFVVLGDRFETMAATIAAFVCRVPVAHIQGGELTLGAIDEQFRHSITKMSLLHFVTTDEHEKRVLQLGEDPLRVFNYGAINVEAMKRVEALEKEEVEKEISFSFGSTSILVTFHPVTLESNTAGEQFSQLLEAIHSFDNLRIIFTKTNADTDGRIINDLIDKFVEENPKKSIAFTSLGQLLYINALRYIDVVVGNSSSGIIETPTFKVPTVDIGDREKGRVMAANIINCEQSVAGIREAVETALSEKFKESLCNMTNPYEQDNTAKNIANKLGSYHLPRTAKKEFHDILSRTLE
jgi:GDP/UDP-N,N'-diacetylbacillosamine 2-epimerase (hydrolysing)